jgi:hypothetical protein
MAKQATNKASKTDQPKPRGRPKASAPKAHPAGAEPLKNAPTDEQTQALFLTELVKLERLVAEKDVAVKDIRVQRKSMKGDGFSAAQVNYALELRRKAPDASIVLFRERATVARWLAHPVGHQFSLFGEDEDRTPAVDSAREEGRVAGMEGVPCKPRYDPSTEQFREYMAGYHEGQEVLAKGIKEKAEGMPSAPAEAEETEPASVH